MRTDIFEHTSHITHHLLNRLRRADRLIVVLVTLWALTMISLPIVRWTLGDAALQRGIVAGVLVQVTVVLAILQRAWGGGQTLLTAGAVCLLAWSAEWLGSSTGFPFGGYDYTPVLQPQVLGVPLLIPLAWLMMLPPGWALGWLLARHTAHSHYLSEGGGLGWRVRFAWAGASALAFSAWDLFLDPQMVAWGFWVWDAPGGYFGIPWVNYAGWLLVSGLVTLAVSAWVNPLRLPLGPLVAVYVITWLLQSIGQVFFWGLPGPGLVGFVGMGGVLLLAWRKTIRMDTAVRA
jgi:putative membrane protein